MSATAATFNVWTQIKDDEESWELQLSTDDYDAALGTAQRLGRDEVLASIYELGRYEADGQEYTDQILFWWSKNAYEAYDAEPEGRGRGCPENRDEWVDYTPVGSGTGLALSGGKAVASRNQALRYRTVTCDNCGLILPQNETHKISEEVEVGRSSASYRVSTSSSRRAASHNAWSTTSRQGLSRSSGRHHYKTVEKLLCESCYATHQSENYDDADSLWSILLFLIGVVLAIIGLTSILILTFYFLSLYK